MAAGIRKIRDVADVYIPQDLDYPALRLEIDRMRAGELGLSEKEVVTNIITALTSNQMVAPNVWIDPRNNNNYFLNVQYPDTQIQSMLISARSLFAPRSHRPTRLDMVSKITRFEAPTEVDHYQIRRTIDIFVRPHGEDLGRIADGISKLIAGAKIPTGVDVNVRGSVEGMRASLTSFAQGLVLSLMLLYLIMVAQFRSFTDPFLILLAFPPGLIGVILTLWLTGTTLNVMSLMGVVMLAGITMSDSILIVEFARRLLEDGVPVRDAVIGISVRCGFTDDAGDDYRSAADGAEDGRRQRILRTTGPCSLGLTVSGMCTVFVVPAGFYLAYRTRPAKDDKAERVIVSLLKDDTELFKQFFQTVLQNESFRQFVPMRCSTLQVRSARSRLYKSLFSILSTRSI